MLLSVFIITFLCMRHSQSVFDDVNESDNEVITQLMHFQSDVANVNWNLQKSVELLRNIIIKRIRCDSPSAVLHQKVCEECLSAERILNITKGADPIIDNRSHRGEDITRIQDLGYAAVVFLNYFLSFQSSCTSESIRYGYVGSCRMYDQCLAELHGYISPISSDSSAENLEAIEKILREVKVVYEPDPTQTCFSAEDILKELNTRSKKFQSLPRDISTVLLITSHLLSGECIDVGESVADFLDDIFLHYGDGCERVITESGFTKLWYDLQMQRKGKHVNHAVPKRSCAFQSTEPLHHTTTAKTVPIYEEDPNRNDTDYVNFNIMAYNETGYMREDSTIETTATTEIFQFNDSSIETDDFTTILDQNMNKPRDAIWAPNKLPINHSSLESISGTVTAPDGVITKERSTTSKRKVRHTTDSEGHEHKNLANECLPSEDLLRRFLTHGNKVLTSADFLQLCPALVQQAVSGVCTNARIRSPVTSAEAHNNFKNNETDVVSELDLIRGSSWHALVAVSLIQAASFLGFFMVPFLNRPIFRHISAYFMGLSFGTMSGDSVLHLIPQYLGLHKHDEDGHDHGSEEDLISILFPKHLRLQLTFWLTMYVLFLAQSIFSTLSGEERENHGHSHEFIDFPMKDLSTPSDLENAEAPQLPLRKKMTEFLKPSNLFSGLSSKAVVILLADTVHNFADGMAIAAGFSTSYKNGISTSVAVLFHELPHEIGDLAILMHAGLSFWKAIAFNILSGFSAFIGLGLGLYTASLYREWLLCITAGLFFYVIMGEMLPDMRWQALKKWKGFVIKIFGTICGITIMICIAVYELSAD